MKIKQMDWLALAAKGLIYGHKAADRHDMPACPNQTWVFYRDHADGALDEIRAVLRDGVELTSVMTSWPERDMDSDLYKTFREQLPAKLCKRCPSVNTCKAGGIVNGKLT